MATEPIKCGICNRVLGSVEAPVITDRMRRGFECDESLKTHEDGSVIVSFDNRKSLAEKQKDAQLKADFLAATDKVDFIAKQLKLK